MSDQPAAPPPGRARYQRSMGGMAGALIITLLAVGAFVGFRALNRDSLEVTPEPVEYLPVVTAAQSEGMTPVYPLSLPEGWIVTSVDFRPAAATPAWGLGMLTGAESFAGIRQGGDTLQGLVDTYVDPNADQGPAVQVDTEVATRWQTFTDSGGDRAYAAEVDGQPLLVYGSASDADLRTLLVSLSTAAR